MSIVVSSLAEVDFETIARVFTAGYEGYLVPVSLNGEQVQAFMTRYNIDRTSSQMAYRDDKPVGIGFLGKRGKQAWVGGIGIPKVFRRRGIGEHIMNKLTDVARSAGITEIHLEFIIGNDAAQSLYEKLGYEIKRKLLIIESQTPPTLDTDLYTIEETTIEEALGYYGEFHRLRQAWQRQPESLRGYAPNAKGWLAQRGGKTQGYIIGIPKEPNFSLFDIACASGESNSLIALLAHVHQPDTTVRLVNLADNDPVWQVLSGLGYQETMAQYEMCLKV